MDEKGQGWKGKGRKWYVWKRREGLGSDRNDNDSTSGEDRTERVRRERRED